ncbi:MAG: hypothetical protein H6839_08360 [Planctomycetes bacterium]|nr:hypothetical protein [Planctomycetota bacterium]
MKYLPLLIAALLLAACAEGPIPRYAGPAGEGRLVYDPAVGITRESASTNQTEQAIYADVEKAFSEHRYEVAINASITLAQNYPDGSRVVDALRLRVLSRLELGRNDDPETGLARTLTLDQWLFLYLAPIHDDRLQAMINHDAESRKFVTDLRAIPVGDFVNSLAPDADSLYDAGQLEAALFDCQTLLTYYLPALELRTFRNSVAELTRDVAWLLYAARAFDATIRLTDDLLAMNPSPAVKADALFIQGQAQRRNGAHALSANTFALLFNGAGLRDTDTRWRPYALMWQINETMASSKGHIYDLVPYEAAMELLGEYELYAIENPNIPAAVHEEFIKLMDDVYGIMIERDENSADQYSRLGEGDAADYYMARAAEWGAQRDKRIAELRSTYAPREQ